MKFLRNRDRLILFLLLVVSVTAYFSFKNFNGHVGGVAELDGYYYYVYLRSLHMDGDIDFANEYKDWGNTFAFGKTPTGMPRNIFGIGPAVVWTPFFLLTHLLVLLGSKLGYPLMLDSMSRIHQVGTFFGSLLYGWLAVVLCYRIARQIWGREHAIWAALGAALAGPMPFYCLTMASYSHAPAAMAASLTIYLWLRFRGNWTIWRWVLFGAAGGLTVLIRPACMAFILLPLMEGLKVLLPALRQRSPAALIRTLYGPLAGAVAALAVFSPQIVVWKILYGTLITVPQGQGFMRWSETAWHATLFSPRNGLLTMAPLVTVALIGLVASLRSRPRVGLPLLVVMAGMLITNGAAYDWWGWGFSARRFTCCLPIFAFGLAAALKGVREFLGRKPRRSLAWITAAVVLTAIIFNLQWMDNFGKQWMTWTNLRSSQSLYMTVTHSLMDRTFKSAGNPLSLPASLAFTLRRGGTPYLYDRLGGAYLLGEAHPRANPSAKSLTHSTMVLSDLQFRYNLSESFGYPVQAGGVRYAPLREPRGHIFLPINRPGMLQMRIGGKASHPGTHLELLFNNETITKRDLPDKGWSIITTQVPARLVERGINRLDLIHTLARGHGAPGSRLIGATNVSSPVDIGVVSGGLNGGNFTEIWVDGRKVSDNVRGLNLAIIDAQDGSVLATRGLDVMARPALYRELPRFLNLFPEGSIVALGVRDFAGVFFNFDGQGRKGFDLIGAGTNLRKLPKNGYAVIGVIGAPPNTALEQNASRDHARVRVGRPPPPWQEIAQYRFLQLR